MFIPNNVEQRGLVFNKRGHAKKELTDTKKEDMESHSKIKTSDMSSL